MGKIELRPLLFAIAAAVVCVAIYFVWRHQTAVLHYLAAEETKLRSYNTERPVLTAAILFALFVGSYTLSIPIGIVLAVFTGWLFKNDAYGFVKAVVLVNCGWTLGATLSFLISRYLLRDAISHHFTSILKKADEYVERDGALYVLTLRLVHVIPFWVTNLVMAWTTISVRTFWWASQIGMLPATLLYVYAGYELPSINKLATDGVSSLLDWKIVVLFLLLAVLPLGLRWIVDRLRHKRP
jgi:uncharacterized membrane protein YdjX (TVP38/TMEM64 family)